jgi:light-harvesting complex I chlorophyll a/b binding protein 1
VLQWGTLPTILAIKFVVIVFTEHQRTMEKGPEKKYPGSAFDSLGFSKDQVKLEEYKQ